MARVLFTMFNSNDLGPISRLLPIAQELSKQGWEIAFCNRAKTPAQVIQEAGFRNMSVRPSQKPSVRPADKFAEVWSANLFACDRGFLDIDFVRAIAQDYVKVMQAYNPDVIVDTWGFQSSLAAKILRKPLVSITQADLHPEGRGFVWWRQPPPDLPNPVPIVNMVLKENGLPLLKRKMEELLMGDMVLVVGTPDTDPLPESSEAIYVGALQTTTQAPGLPNWIQELPTDFPLVWVYSGTPRYGDRPSKVDSIVVIRASLALLGNEDVTVVLTTGHQPLPEEFSTLPSNVHFTPYVPGFAMAKRSDLLIHHGGHGSYLTGLSAGTPAVVIPTYSERESNARRLTELGAGECILPQTDESGEKTISMHEFREKAWRVLTKSDYKQNALRIARNLQQYGGAVQAADLIEELAGRMCGAA
jgi:UDP:flavonoid glycosyltransferase YjiC (YdhE family)